MKMCQEVKEINKNILKLNKINVNTMEKKRFYSTVQLNVK